MRVTRLQGPNGPRFADRHAARLVALLAAASSTALVIGCGFHLRTWDVASNVQSAYVAADPRNPLKVPLERALRQAGVAPAASEGEAEVVVELLDSRRERRSITVSGQGRAVEYETTLGVRYRVTGREGDELVPDQWLQRERVFRVDRDNIVGSSEEQALLEREMQNDLVQQILRALNTVGAEATGAD